jgi:hypothetical protein
MSQISMTNSHAHGHDHHGHHGHGHFDLSPANTTAPGFGKGAMVLCFALGLAGLGANIAYPFVTGGDDQAKLIKHAFYSYHVGMILVLMMMLGCMGLTLITRAVQAGWSTTLRRQCENVVSLMPLFLLLVLPTVLAGSYMFKWQDPAIIASDPVLHEKIGFLNKPFFIARLALYAIVWCVLAAKLFGYSRKQDDTGDTTLTNKAQTLSAWGLLAYALTTAFASFDLVKALDFHWFSTMFGVYFFAGCIVSGISLTVLMLTALRTSGKLRGLVTAEHYHDLGKLLFGLNIFWTYVAFSQYFLYWYADIPEETAWFIARMNNGWQNFFWVLVFGHFIAPFLILIFRGVKRSTFGLSFLASWLLLMTLVDAFWLIRPVVFMTSETGAGLVPGKIGFAWVDIAGIVGPVALFVGVLIFKIGRSPLIPMRDPRLNEALEHKNYV